MSSNYKFTENEVQYYFDDVFVPTRLFRQPNLWSWGDGSNSRLGQQTDTTNRSTPISTILSGSNWRQISVLNAGTIGIKDDGSLWFWGANAGGQAGVNNNLVQRTAVTTILGGNNWKYVQAGNTFWNAIKEDGSFWVCGDNLLGQLGVGDIVVRSTPTTTILGGNDWRQVSNNTTAWRSGGIKNDGSLWMWGNNLNGQLGVGDTVIRSTPVTTILGGNDWKQVSLGVYYTGAIKTDGSLWVWGAGSFIGINDTASRSTPVTTILGGNNWKQVSFGGLAGAAAIKTDGTLWIWGGDSVSTYGEIGTNDNVRRLTPTTTILGGNNWKYVSIGNSTSAAIKTDGSLWVWGQNISGNLGVNDLVHRSTPITTILGKFNWRTMQCASSIGTESHIVGILEDPFFNLY